MAMGMYDSQSAIEQKKRKRTTLTFIVGVCLSFYFNVFEFSDWFFKNTI